ncbi:unnamed protein product [Calypogeia fissa]
MRLVVDSPAHQHAESTWPKFDRDPRHVRLGLVSDGVSPHPLGGKGWPTSIWPVVIMNYNLPPWLSMKKGFLLLYLIIPGSKKVKILTLTWHYWLMSSKNCGMEFGHTTGF